MSFAKDAVFPTQMQDLIKPFYSQEIWWHR